MLNKNKKLTQNPSLNIQPDITLRMNTVTEMSHTTFVTCGSTAEEAGEGHKQLMEEWEKSLEKEAEGPYRDRRKLK